MVCLQADISGLALRVRARASRARSYIALAPLIRLFCRLSVAENLQVLLKICRVSPLHGGRRAFRVKCGQRGRPQSRLKHRPVLGVVRPLVRACVHLRNETPHPQGQWPRPAKCQRAHTLQQKPVHEHVSVGQEPRQIVPQVSKAFLRFL